MKLDYKLRSGSAYTSKNKEESVKSTPIINAAVTDIAFKSFNTIRGCYSDLLNEFHLNSAHQSDTKEEHT